VLLSILGVYLGKVRHAMRSDYEGVERVGETGCRETGFEFHNMRTDSIGCEFERESFLLT